MNLLLVTPQLLKIFMEINGILSDVISVVQNVDQANLAVQLLSMRAISVRVQGFRQRLAAHSKAATDVENTNMATRATDVGFNKQQTLVSEVSKLWLLLGDRGSSGEYASLFVFLHCEISQRRVSNSKNQIEIMLHVHDEVKSCIDLKSPVA